LLPDLPQHKTKFKQNLELEQEKIDVDVKIDSNSSSNNDGTDDGNDDDDEQLMEAVDTALIEGEKSGSKTATTRPIDARAQLCLTGHSMGGATASLLAVCLAERAHWREAIHVHTFGAPPVGGSGVARLAVLEQLHRYVRPGDVVPHRVPVSGYQHVGYEVLLTPSRFARIHELASGAQRRATSSGGGVWSSASLLMALGVEPHSIVGYYRDVERLYDAMLAWRAPPPARL
jgi:hypothetical protein